MFHSALTITLTLCAITPHVELGDCLLDITGRVAPLSWPKKGFAGTTQSFFISTAGQGQVCYDGEIWHAAPDAKAAVEMCTSLGPNMNKEDDFLFRQRLSYLPAVVGVVEDHIAIINLVCWPTFPDAPDPEEQPTGNVVAYDINTRAFSALTRLDGSTNEYMEALAYFPDVDVLLIKRSSQSGSDMPSAKEGTGTPLCMEMATREIVSIDRYPAIKDWYEFHESLSVRPVGEYPWDRDQETGHYRWVVAQGGQHRIGVETEEWTRPGVFPLWGGFVLLTDHDTGSELVKMDGSIRIRITEHIIFDVDIGTAVAAAESEDGSRTFLIDLGALLAKLDTALPAHETLSDNSIK